MKHFKLNILKVDIFGLLRWRFEIVSVIEELAYLH